jgi:hypothetical protein
MDQRLSLVTLGVRDLDQARRFYDALGWTTGWQEGEDVVFFQAGGMIVALWGRDQLAADSGVRDGGEWGGITLAQNVGSPEEVDRVIGEAERAGARITRPGAETFWVAMRVSSSTPRVMPGRSRITHTGRSRKTAPSAFLDAVREGR